MAESNILTKAAQAVGNYLADGGVTANIYVGESNSDKELPCVSVTATSSGIVDGQEFTGNRMVSLLVEVISNAADDQGYHASLVKEVGDLLNSDTLDEDLSASLDNFTCIGHIPSGENSDADGDAWGYAFAVSLLCCPSDI